MKDRKAAAEKFLKNAAKQPDSTPFLQRPGAAKKLLIGGAIALPTFVALCLGLALAGVGGSPAPVAPVATVQPAQPAAPVAVVPPKVKVPEPVVTPAPTPVEETKPPEPQTYAEAILAKAIGNTPGLFARETLGLADPDAFVADVMPGVCQAVEPSLISLDQTESLLADSLRREAGYDKDKAANIASGLIKTALEPGVCESVKRGDPD